MRFYRKHFGKTLDYGFALKRVSCLRNARHELQAILAMMECVARLKHIKETQWQWNLRYKKAERG